MPTDNAEDQTAGDSSPAETQPEAEETPPPAPDPPTDPPVDDSNAAQTDESAEANSNPPAENAGADESTVSGSSCLLRQLFELTCISFVKPEEQSPPAETSEPNPPPEGDSTPPSAPDAEGDGGKQEPKTDDDGDFDPVEPDPEQSNANDASAPSGDAEVPQDGGPQNEVDESSSGPEKVAEAPGEASPVTGDAAETQEPTADPPQPSG